LSTPASISLSPAQQSPENLAKIIPELGLPLIVKPPHEGSSIGVTKVEHAHQLDAAMALAIGLDPTLLAEAFIEGDEVTCPVLGQGTHVVALPVVRIAAPNGAYDYQNKYFTDEVKYHCPRCSSLIKHWVAGVGVGLTSWCVAVINVPFCWK
jgi:D-alanine-D-alanine ligase